MPCSIDDGSGGDSIHSGNVEPVAGFPEPRIGSTVTLEGVEFGRVNESRERLDRGIASWLLCPGSLRLGERLDRGIAELWSFPQLNSAGAEITRFACVTYWSIWLPPRRSWPGGFICRLTFSASRRNASSSSCVLRLAGVLRPLF